MIPSYEGGVSSVWMSTCLHECGLLSSLSSQTQSRIVCPHFSGSLRYSTTSKHIFRKFSSIRCYLSAYLEMFRIFLSVSKFLVSWYPLIYKIFRQLYPLTYEFAPQKKCSSKLTEIILVHFWMPLLIRLCNCSLD